MTKIVATSEKFDWKNVLFWASIGVIVYYIVIVTNEGNDMFWWGVLAFIAGLVGIANLEVRKSKQSSYVLLMLSLLSFVFALMSPFLHFGASGVFVNSKVWMVDGKTTMNHNILWRSPFSKFATSINEKQDVSLTVSGKTKDGTAVVATLTGAFSISDDEQVVIKHFSKMQNPDIETKDMLKKALQKSFEKVIGTMTVTDIATAKNNFAIEHTIATIVKVNTLGLIGSGPLVISDIHPNLKK